MIEFVKFVSLVFYQKVNRMVFLFKKRRFFSNIYTYAVLIALLTVCGSQTSALSRQSISLINGTVRSTIILPDYPSWSYKGVSSGDEMGYSVSGAGDINGDGYDDVIVGSPQYTTNIDPEGVAFVFHGSDHGLSSSPDWLSNGIKGSRFGHSVSGAGDVNGDGYDDVIIGAPYYKVDFGGSGVPQSGAVFVFHGSDIGLGEDPAWEMLAEAPDIDFGFAVSDAGDVNNDGFDDVIVGAWKYESADEQANEGKVYLYLGGLTGLSDTPVWTFECNSPTASCGRTLASAGDVNGDGFDDVIVGAQNYDGDFDQEGAAYLFFGNAGGLSISPDWTIQGGQENAMLGSSVSGAGDVNDDGYDDVLVGSQGYSTGELILNGATFAYYGSSTGLNTTQDWVTYGEEDGSRYGCSVHSAGDINQDGYGDVLIGSYYYGSLGSPDNQPDEGAAYLFNGGETGLGTLPSWEGSGRKANAWFGYSVGTAGDVNGDGMEDVIIGAPYYKWDDKTPVGIAFAFYAEMEADEYSVYLPFIIFQEQ